MLRIILDWSEAWAPLLPLLASLVYRNGPAYLKPIRVYAILAFLINLASTLIWYRKRLGIDLPENLDSNTFLYNLHSIVTLVCFSIFFIQLHQRFMHRVKIALPFLFLVLTAVNFIWFEDFFSHVNLSSRLLASEAAFLLFYCLQYYIFLMIDDRSTPVSKRPGIWVVIGLTFYVSINFFIFLFYIYLSDADRDFAVDIWDLHNIVYIILCVFLAIAFRKRT
jgi:hypothetical protein